MLSRDAERALHQRLLEHDAGAVSRCCTLYIPLVHATLRRRCQAAFAHLLEEAVDTAVFDYVKNPERYDPERLPLESYLRMAAWRDFQTLAERELRQLRRQTPLAAVELSLVGENDEQRDDLLALPEGMTMARVWQALEQQVSDPIDRRILRLMVIDEVRETAAYARVLGIEHWDIKRQRVEVKKVKDRLSKRLRRLGERLRDDDSA